jgi:hypothetical protein
MNVLTIWGQLMMETSITDSLTINSAKKEEVDKQGSIDVQAMEHG